MVVFSLHVLSILYLTRRATGISISSLFNPQRAAVYIGTSYMPCGVGTYSVGARRIYLCPVNRDTLELSTPCSLPHVLLVSDMRQKFRWPGVPSFLPCVYLVLGVVAFCGYLMAHPFCGKPSKSVQIPATGYY